MEKKDYIGHRERLKNKYKVNRIQGLYDYEVLELLLTFSIPRKDVKPLAKLLINKYKSIENILYSNINELITIKGIGENTAIFLTLIGEINKLISKNKLYQENKLKLNNKSLLIEHLRNELGFLEIEKFKIIFLDNSGNFIGEEILFTGTIDKSAIYPREIIKKVLDNKAKGIIFAHNHPSGNLKPSRSDIMITQHMKEALNFIEVKLLDHIIITSNSYFSFSEENLL